MLICLPSEASNPSLGRTHNAGARWRTFLIALAAIGVAVATNAAAAEPQNCKLIRIDEWSVKPDAAVPILDGVINGHKIAVMLDTGLNLKEGALLERAAARRLGVPLQPYPGREFAGIGGETQAAIGIIGEIKIGHATRRNWRVLVGGEDHGHQGAFIIGNAFFRDIELEFDLAHDAVRLFKSRNCRGVSLAYWATEPAGEVPIWVDDGHITVEVLINGKPVRAVLDSGASTTLLDMSLAGRLGVTKETAGTLAGRCLRGFGKEGVDSWIGQFETFAIGNEMIRNPKMYFGELWKHLPLTMSGFFKVRKYDMPEMILGADFLRAHRLLIARGHGKLVFTYAGDTVFPTRTSAPCKS